MGQHGNTAFVKHYDTPSVRSTVQSQLQGMADGGATVIHTRLWLVTGTGDDDFGQAWRTHFPLSAAEAANLRAYVQDVAAIRAADGHHGGGTGVDVAYPFHIQDYLP